MPTQVKKETKQDAKKEVRKTSKNSKTLTCCICGKKFKRLKGLIRENNNSYCSRTCYLERNRKTVKVKCANCGKELERSLSKFNPNSNSYCNIECMYEKKRKDKEHRDSVTTTTPDVPGVRYRKDVAKWIAYISVHGKYEHLGYFENIEGAIKAREEAVKKYRHTET